MHNPTRRQWLQTAAAIATPTNPIGTRPGERREVSGVALRWCPAGEFMMGSPTDEPGHRPDERQVRVTLTRGFWMGEAEVTQPGTDLPMTEVSYLEAEEFCRRLNLQAREAGQLPADWAFRLPTEAEWEYACRAGTVTATHYGDSLGHSQANFKGKPYNGGDDSPAPGAVTKAGRYRPNAWGLLDMHGNVWDLCRDWYHSTLPGGADPDLWATKGLPNRDGTYSRVRRGGAFVEDGWACRSACRLRYEPDRRSDHIGFRLVLAKALASPP